MCYRDFAFSPAMEPGTPPGPLVVAEAGSSEEDIAAQAWHLSRSQSRASATRRGCSLVVMSIGIPQPWHGPAPGRWRERILAFAVGRG